MKDFYKDWKAPEVKGSLSEGVLLKTERLQKQKEVMKEFTKTESAGSPRLWDFRKDFSMRAYVGWGWVFTFLIPDFLTNNVGYQCGIISDGPVAQAKGDRKAVCNILITKCFVISAYALLFSQSRQRLHNLYFKRLYHIALLLVSA